MARRGGFQGGMPGNMNNMLKQAQRMQKQLEEAQEKLAEMEITGSAGGGVVEAVVSGSKELKSIKINPEAVDPDDVETLEDLILVAVNNALNGVDTASEELTGGMAGGLSNMGLGGLGGLPF
jgi:hypothetical protein